MKNWTKEFKNEQLGLTVEPNQVGVNVSSNGYIFHVEGETDEENNKLGDAGGFMKDLSEAMRKNNIKRLMFYKS